MKNILMRHACTVVLDEGAITLKIGNVYNVADDVADKLIGQNRAKLDLTGEAPSPVVPDPELAKSIVGKKMAVLAVPKDNPFLQQAYGALTTAVSATPAPAQPAASTTGS